MTDTTPSQPVRTLARNRLRQTRHKLAIICIGTLLFAPFILSDYYLFIASTVILLAIFTATWDFFTGLTGYFSFAHMFIVALSSYLSALLTAELGVPLLVSIPIAAVITGTFGIIVIAGPSLRLGGIYFAALTFILPVYGEDIIILFSGITGGLGGYIYVTPISPVLVDLLPGDLSASLLAYYLSVAMLVLIVGTLVIVSKSQFGMVLRGISQDETLLSSIGINPVGFKIVGFGLVAFSAAFAGSVWTHILVTLSPGNQLSMMLMIDIIIAATIGGLGTIVGPAIGMIILQIIDNGIVSLQASLNSVPFGINIVEFQRVINVTIAIVFFYLYPGGIYPSLRRWLDSFDHESDRTENLELMKSPQSQKEEQD